MDTKEFYIRPKKGTELLFSVNNRKTVEVHKKRPVL